MYSKVEQLARLFSIISEMNLPIIMARTEQKQSLPKDCSKQRQEMTTGPMKVLKEQTVYRTDFRLIWVIYIFMILYKQISREIIYIV